MLDPARQSNLPEIIFYVLASHLQEERQDFACKLIEKIYRSGRSCYVLTDSEQQAVSMDKQLWTFRAGSFIPHQIYRGIVPELTQTVLIGWDTIPETRQNLIVNLSASIPNFGAETERIAEILDNSEMSKQIGRQRYRHYQQLGLTITTHNM